MLFTFAYDFTCKMGCDLRRTASLWPHMCRACFFELVLDRWGSGLGNAMKLCCLRNFEATLDKTNKLILLRGVMMRAHGGFVWNKHVFDKGKTKK